MLFKNNLVTSIWHLAKMWTTKSSKEVGNRAIANEGGAPVARTADCLCSVKHLVNK